MNRPFIHENDYARTNNRTERINRLKTDIISLCRDLTFGIDQNTRNIVMKIRENVSLLDQLEHNFREASDE